MSSDDEYFDDDEEELVDEYAAKEAAEAEAAALEAAKPQKVNVRDWMKGKRGWILLGVLAMLQAIFAIVMLLMRSDAKPVVNVNFQHIQELALDMLGYEVDVRQIYQLVPLRGGKKMTVGLDIVMVLGQLPEERIEGSERPTPEEFALFIETIRSMEPNIRSRVNILLQQMPPEVFGTVEANKIIKEDVMKYVNDTLEGLNFGDQVRPMLGKRRVTDVLLPMFIRQTM